MTNKQNSAQKSDRKKFESPEHTEETFIRMCKLLLNADTVLSGAGINVDKQDRLGRTILHLAAQYDFKNLTEVLLRSKAEGGFGAHADIGDMIN